MKKPRRTCGLKPNVCTLEIGTAIEGECGSVTVEYRPIADFPDENAATRYAYAEFRDEITNKPPMYRVTRKEKS